MAEGIEVKTGSTVITTVLGQAVDPIKVSYEFKKYLTREAAEAADKWLSDSDILDVVNANSERTALAAARNEATKSQADTIRTSVDYRRRQWIENTLKAMPNLDPEVVKSMAEANIQ